MRQVFTSPRLENVEGVAKLLTDANIEIKVSDDRGYKQVSRREFSYVQKARDGGNQPAVWVIKSEDYKRARELLHHGPDRQAQVAAMSLRRCSSSSPSDQTPTTADAHQADLVVRGRRRGAPG
jgi:hypothetical protein